MVREDKTRYCNLDRKSPFPDRRVPLDQNTRIRQYDLRAHQPANGLFTSFGSEAKWVLE